MSLFGSLEEEIVSFMGEVRSFMASFNNTTTAVTDSAPAPAASASQVTVTATDAASAPTVVTTTDVAVPDQSVATVTTPVSQ